MEMEPENQGEMLRAKMEAMAERDRLGYAVSEEEHSLERLHYWLKYEVLSGWLMVGGFWLPYSLIATVLIILAFVFTPYMLWQLAKARWYKSIAVFVIFVIVPFVISRLMPADLSMSRFLLLMTPLVIFYIYTLALRHVIGEYLAESRAVREMDYRLERGSTSL